MENNKIDKLWRYPVKSLLGESCQRYTAVKQGYRFAYKTTVPALTAFRGQEVTVDRRGVVGDRWFAIRDRNGKFGSAKNTRRFRKIDRQSTKLTNPII